MDSDAQGVSFTAGCYFGGGFLATSYSAYLSLSGVIPATAQAVLMTSAWPRGDGTW